MPVDESELAIEPVGIEQLQAISELAHHIWHLHYPGIISRAQIDYMLDQRYSPSHLAETLDRRGSRLLVARRARNAMGFALLAPAEDASDEVNLHAFYLHPDHHGRGYGRRFMDHLVDYARSEHYRDMTLNVNRLNIKAINFYFRAGFTIRSVVDIDLGRGFMANDFIMVRDLA
jgi:GNAT superfamily N-acetyltransferase